jgi:hypothetical protein
MLSERGHFIPPPRPRGHLSAPEVAAQIGVGRQLVTYWCRRNPGLARRVDGKWWLHPAKLAEFLRTYRGGTHAPR